MSTQTRELDDVEVLFWLGLVGLAFFGAGVWAVVRDGSTAWLLEHGVLLGAGESQLLSVPGAGGAGLDAARVAVGVAGVAAAVVVAVLVVRRRRGESA